MMASSPISLLSKTKSWLWHRRLSHLNFVAINHLARHGLVRSLLKLKFEKEHLCSACIIGKSKQKPHKPKSKDTNQEKLYLLHMDLCRPMRVASVNGKKYILVIVDDYSRFTWVKFLRSKDEAPDFIIKRIIETIHVDFDELTMMASEHNSSGPALHEMTLVIITPEVIAPINEVVALVPAVSTGLPSSTIVDQDAPSPKVSSDQSSSTNIIHPIMHPDHQISKHNSKWTKDHPLENIIGELDRRDQSNTREPNEFERLGVWELVPLLDKVMVITLKWIYKVKLDELGGILKNKSRLVARGYRKEEGIGFVESFTPVARLEDIRIFLLFAAHMNMFVYHMDISQSPRGIFINKLKYALESLKKYGFDSCDPVDTPMVKKSKLDEDKEGKAVNPSHYRGMIGTLLYLTASRPDLSKHIDIRFHFIKKHVENGVIELYFVNTEYQLADIFTKALGRERIEFLINKLGMRSFTPETLKQLADEVDE
ncbi:retrovirus-related pol polyprotein from transposon TNT 1-94 [Tanacetum coccineum]|uniref:Retrovirus-related pol polyprotein from transposon TNT 1-94 n=1 Tax=Tanacetum coccineum TaxID=301880 RepID=A0ABQ5CGR9_9ASTR